jgi:hypothetical protein
MADDTQTQRTGSLKLWLGVMTPLLAVPAIAVLLIGGRMVYRPLAIVREAYHPAVPLEGAYSAEELKQAQAAVSGLLPPEKLIEGMSRQEIEKVAEARREIERMKKTIWERRRAQRVEQARGQRTVGWGLTALGIALLGSWGWALRGIWGGFSSKLG